MAKRKSAKQSSTTDAEQQNKSTKKVKSKSAGQAARKKKSQQTARKKTAGARKKAAASQKQDEAKPQPAKEHCPVVGIGASAGGLDAFKKLFVAMPSDSGLAFVLIQHLDPDHESLMADLLSK